MEVCLHLHCQQASQQLKQRMDGGARQCRAVIPGSRHLPVISLWDRSSFSNTLKWRQKPGIVPCQQADAGPYVIAAA